MSDRDRKVKERKKRRKKRRDLKKDAECKVWDRKNKEC